MSPINRLARLEILTNEECEETLEYEDPSPAGFSSNAAHFVDSTSKETPECTGRGGGGEKESHAETTFMSSVPEGDVVCHT